MQKRVILLVTVLLPLLAIVMLVRQRDTNEPYYNGRPLHYWTLQLKDETITNDQPAVDAINQMGTNALPLLIRWIQYETPDWRYSFAYRIGDLPPAAIFQPLADHIRYDPRKQLADAAEDAIDCLSSNAAPAIGELVRFMNNKDKMETATRAISALSYIGAKSIPPMLQAINNPDHPWRGHVCAAVLDIDELDNTDRLSVSNLLEHLREADPAYCINTGVNSGAP